MILNLKKLLNLCRLTTNTTCHNDHNIIFLKKRMTIILETAKYMLLAVFFFFFYVKFLIFNILNATSIVYIVVMLLRTKIRNGSVLFIRFMAVWERMRIT